MILINCELTRHSDDVLKKDRNGRIFIEAHRCVTEGQKNHNTKEAILNAIDNKVEAVETDVWLTKDKKVILSHDKIITCFGLYEYNEIPGILDITNSNWPILKQCKNGGYEIPLLEDIIQISKGEIFLNLEIKDDNYEIWDKIQELIEKYEYYDQIAISSFNHNYYEKVETYNNDFNRTIVFGFLGFSGIFDYNKKYIFNINKPKNQISLNAQFIINNPEIVKEAHDKGMAVGLWFFSDIMKEPNNYYEIFNLGIDVIITDYPIRVANQLEEYKSDKVKLEGCKSIEKNYKNISSCISCKNGYELVHIEGQSRNLCKLKYEIVPDLYIKDDYGIYQEKNIFAIKMLYFPIKKEAMYQKNGKTIFYFEWLFDLYGYDYDIFNSNYILGLQRYQRKYILDKDKIKYSSTYSLLTEEHIKRLNFNGIQVYIDNNLINQNDFLCLDLYDTSYYSIYTVLGAHCYFIYNGEQKASYNVKFRLFDDNYLSFVKYNDKFLYNEGSWEKFVSISFYNSLNSDSICDEIKDPFQDRKSCIEKINPLLF